MTDVLRMLADWIEWLDDEDGEGLFPDWAGETGWVTNEDGSMEDWGQYLLRLAHDEIASLTEKVERLRELLLAECEAHAKAVYKPKGNSPKTLAKKRFDALLEGE